MTYFMAIIACDTKVSMLLSSLIANIKVLSRFFFFLLIFSNFFTISVVREKNKVRLALAIATGAPTIPVNEIIDTPPLVALKIKLGQYNQKQQHIWLIFYCTIFFD